MPRRILLRDELCISLLFFNICAVCLYVRFPPISHQPCSTMSLAAFESKLKTYLFSRSQWLMTATAAVAAFFSWFWRRDINDFTYLLTYLRIYDSVIGWPDFDFFIPGHWFCKARRTAAWDPRTAENGDGFLGGASPSPPARGSGERCELPQHSPAGSGAEPRPPNDFPIFEVL